MPPCAIAFELSFSLKGGFDFLTSNAPAKNSEIFGILKLSCCQKGAYTTDKGQV
jgi:hypothetical protein